VEICVMIEGQEDVTWERWVDLARVCEVRGYQGLFRSDHYRSFDRPSERGTLDARATLAGLAAVTERIRLGTMVSLVTFRHPSVLAKSVATVDHISGGRVELVMARAGSSGSTRPSASPSPRTGSGLASSRSRSRSSTASGTGASTRSRSRVRTIGWIPSGRCPSGAGASSTADARRRCRPESCRTGGSMGGRVRHGPRRSGPGAERPRPLRMSLMTGVVVAADRPRGGGPLASPGPSRPGAIDLIT
jgi:hypothetical protein